MYGTYSDPEWEPEEWYYKGFPRKEDRPQKIKPTRDSNKSFSELIKSTIKICKDMHSK